MPLELKYIPYRLHFRFEAGTSRGKLNFKDIYIIRLQNTQNPGGYGYGEVSPLQGLSIDLMEDISEHLDRLAWKVKHLPDDNPDLTTMIKWVLDEVPNDFPAVRFGMEMALRDLWQGGDRCIFPGNFFDGLDSIPINGLVWMGDFDFMKKQIEKKVEDQFRCIKIKVGSLDLPTELRLLEYLRQLDPHRHIEIRLDANGAYNSGEVLEVLDLFARHDIHSVEQPIKTGHWEAMTEICRRSPIPIALDEELIGINNPGELLETIQPQYIILKPTLLGGFEASKEWIGEAERRGIGWWVTSALESDLGLNAIAQFTASMETSMPQGLGTGQLFTNNFTSPLRLHKDQLSYNPHSNWDLNTLKF